MLRLTNSNHKIQFTYWLKWC